jgi:hypothetical protein
MHDDLNRIFNVAIPVLIAKRSGLVASQIDVTIPTLLPSQLCGLFLAHGTAQETVG